MHRGLLVAACSAFVAAIVVPVAAADPSNAKNAGLIHAVCGGQAVTVAVNGNGSFTPAHDVHSTAVFIPTSLNLTFTFTPTGGDSMSETDTSTKNAPIQDTVTCSIPLQTLFSGPEGTGTIQGTVTGFFTPR
jgi:hypothetical protein